MWQGKTCVYPKSKPCQCLSLVYLHDNVLVISEIWYCGIYSEQFRTLQIQISHYYCGKSFIAFQIWTHLYHWYKCGQLCKWNPQYFTFFLLKKTIVLRKMMFSRLFRYVVGLLFRGRLLNFWIPIFNHFLTGARNSLSLTPFCISEFVSSIRVKFIAKQSFERSKFHRVAFIGKLTGYYDCSSLNTNFF